MDVTNQVATLQDEVKLLKGEIKSILKEIRTAVLSRDNPFSVGLEAVQVPNNQSSDPTPPQEQHMPADDPALQIPPTPKAPGPLAPTFQVPAMPQMAAAPQMNSPQPPIVIQGGAPPAPAWAGPVPASQPAPAPFAPAAGPAPLAPPMRSPEPEKRKPARDEPAKDAQRNAEDEASEDNDASEDEEMPDNVPIPIRPAKEQARVAKQQDEEALEEAVPAAAKSSWSLPTIAGLAVWAEEALVSLGPRRFQFVLELATFAELLSSDAREVLASLIDADTLSHEEERPLNVNECLVVLRQLEAIVHGEKVMRLPRRRGIRHRRIR